MAGTCRIYKRLSLDGKAEFLKTCASLGIENLPLSPAQKDAVEKKKVNALGDALEARKMKKESKKPEIATPSCDCGVSHRM